MRHSLNFRGSDGHIIGFKVPASYIDHIRATAIPQKMPDWWLEHGTKEEYDALRSICPEISDPTRGNDLYGLPSSLLDELRSMIVPGSGHIIGK